MLSNIKIYRPLAIVFIKCYCIKTFTFLDKKTRNRELNGLLAGAKALKCDKLTLITFDTAETVTMGDKTIEIVPAIDWLCQR